MQYVISKKQVPEKWDGKYYLTCVHSFNSMSRYDYLMYCNIEKEMSCERVKIRVFGYRWTNTVGERIRYVDRERLVKTSKFKN
ncbi:hypothetical protein A1D23_13000 [Chelonobacter oris]|nr:hypothetical protein [Chelonobacter oris]